MMKVVSPIKNFLKKILPKKISYLLENKFYIPSSLFLKLKFKRIFGYDLDLKNPKTFNEKLQWLKLNDKNPKYTKLVDKYEVKEIVGKMIGENHIIKTLGVYKKFKRINFSALPRNFVIKTTHDSGGVFICKDKNTATINKAKKTIENSLAKKYFYYGREYPYKKIKPRIIIEEYISDESTTGLTDYKFFCFNGYVDCCMVCIDRAIKDTKFYFFDKNWNLRRINKRGLQAPENFTLKKPKFYNKMIEIAEKISQNIPFCRVDLYETENEVYFGEITFYPQSGFDPNILYETDLYFGSLIKVI